MGCRVLFHFRGAFALAPVSRMGLGSDVGGKKESWPSILVSKQASRTGMSCMIPGWDQFHMWTERVKRAEADVEWSRKASIDSRTKVGLLPKK